MRDERELDLPMQSIDCMVSQRLIESEDFSLDSQIMHAASSQPEGLGWPGHSISPPAAYHSCLRAPCGDRFFPNKNSFRKGVSYPTGIKKYGWDDYCYVY